MGILRSGAAKVGSGGSGGSGGITRIGSPSINGKGIDGSDFTEPTKPKPQSNCVIIGKSGQGKSSFVLKYAPEPIAFINLDGRADSAAYRAKEAGRKIHFLKIDMPANPTRLDDKTLRAAAQKAVNQFVRNYEWAVDQSLRGNIRTIAADTATEYAGLVNMAITGRVDRVKGDYGKSKDMINREFWRLFNLARSGNAHLVLLAREQEIWENNEPTGRLKARGPEVIEDGADWCGVIRLATGAKPGKKIVVKRSSVVKEFELLITKGGVNIEELGQLYTQAEWGDEGPFAYANYKQFEETSELEDWT